jgi:hypothetical protein
VDEPEGEMTVMTAAMVQKYCATEEMNGRVNPAAALSDSDEELNNGRPKNPGGGKSGKVGGNKTGAGGGSGGKQRPMASQPDSEDESDRRTPVKNVKQYQTKL